MNPVLNLIDVVSNGSQKTHAGSYRIHGIAAKGGHGVLYDATDTRSNKPRLIKRVRPDIQGIERDVLEQRLKREARPGFSSKHVVTAIDSGTDRDGFYVVFPRKEGKDLIAHSEEGWLASNHEASQILRKTALGLTEMHQSRIIHRDLKPGNVLYEKQSGEVHIIDLGLINAPHTSTRLTRSDRPIGTLAFAAPEVIRDPRTIDHRIDLHALGCLGYWLYTGEAPFEAESEAQAMHRVIYEKPKNLREINRATPPLIASLVEGLLAKDPAQRQPQTAFDAYRMLTGRQPVRSSAVAAIRQQSVHCLGCGMPTPDPCQCTSCHEVYARFAMLRCRLPDGRTRYFRLPIGRYIVGRSEISASCERLSRRQAEFVVTDSEVRVKHLDGRHPTLVDGQHTRRDRLKRVRQSIQLSNVTAELVPWQR
ncbi:MAG: FHA domain-containing serine/threonine-protein kinase [Phycisphaeraceae bacterium]